MLPDETQMDLDATKARIRELRGQLEISQSELARRTGLARITIIKLESPKEGMRRPPSIRTAALIARELGVTVDSLIFPHRSDTITALVEGLITADDRFRSLAELWATLPDGPRKEILNQARWHKTKIIEEPRRASDD